MREEQRAQRAADDVLDGAAEQVVGPGNRTRCNVGQYLMPAVIAAWGAWGMVLSNTT